MATLAQPEPNAAVLGGHSAVAPGANAHRVPVAAPGSSTRASSGALGAGRRALLLVQNQSLPGDARVWPQCLALRDAGFEVVAVSPASPEYPQSYSYLDG